MGIWKEMLAQTRDELLHDRARGVWPPSRELVTQLGARLQAVRPDRKIHFEIRTDGLAEFALVLRVDSPRPEAEILKRLTPRERDVARLVAEGFTNREIAVRLAISPATVKDHVQNILERANLRRRAQIAALVTACGGSEMPS